jgi:predicted methyltransferase
MARRRLFVAPKVRRAAVRANALAGGTLMRHFLIAAGLALTACAHPTGMGAPAAAQVTAQSANILAAVSDSRRPAEDTARDGARHPGETLAFAEVQPGDRIGEIFPGGGYCTRLCAVAVGDAGRIYPTIRPDGVAGEYETPILPVAAQYPNTTMSRTSYDALSYPEPLDLVFTAQNYHDMPITAYHLGDRMAMNRTAFAALKPGGLYVVIDHAAVDGSPVQTDAQSAIHRIDQATVRREVEAAGFVYDGEANFLRNPADPRTASVFDPAIRGHSDQFAMRFRRPG